MRTQRSYYLAAFLGALYAPILGTVYPDALSIEVPLSVSVTVAAVFILVFSTLLRRNGFRSALGVAGYQLAYLTTLLSLAVQYLKHGTGAVAPAFFGTFAHSSVTVLSSIQDEKFLLVFIWTAVAMNNAMVYLHPPIHVLWTVALMFYVLYGLSEEPETIAPES
ncbi:MAG: hypothetical protein HGB18_01930 [Candidatus Moranbacteria bacterium]|nr:hypothetical protein [Candidatus Moranbacteria bacterium]